MNKMILTAAAAIMLAAGEAQAATAHKVNQKPHWANLHAAQWASGAAQPESVSDRQRQVADSSTAEHRQSGCFDHGHNQGR